ncbi:MAG TPA: hypothetical protein VFB04_05220 [Terriglobales bacterium]|nr:hypothetical protein [Terriglobales bacterium]
MPAFVAAAILGLASVGSYLLPSVFVPLFASTLGTTLVIGSLTTLANSAIGLLQKKPHLPSFAQDAQTRQLNIRQTVAPWRVIYGEGRYGGILVYVQLTGASNEFIHMVFVHCSGEIEDIPKMYFVNDAGLEEVPVDGSGDATGKYAGYVHWEKRLGTTSPAAYSSLVSDSGGKWTNNHLGKGHAHSYVRLKWSADLFPNGLPEIRWDIKGRKLFDHRTASTAYSRNWALAVRDYITDTTYGLGATASEIDDSSFDAAANLSDEDVSLAGGGSEKRYTANGMFETSATPGSIIPSLLSAGAGQLVYSGGKWSLYGAAWRSPTVTLTDDDFHGPLSVETRISRRDIFNGVKGMIVSPANSYQASDFPPYYQSTARGYGSDAYLAEDGGERIWRDVEYPFTTSIPTAQRLSKIQLERVRRQITVKCRCRLTAYQLSPPDTVRVTHSRFGWTNKTFEVAEAAWTPDRDAQGNPILAVDLTLRESDANVYAWSTSEEESQPAAPTLSVPNLAVALQPQKTLQPVSAANRSSALVGGSPVTASDAGSNATISIAAFNMRFGFGTVGYNSGSITGLAYTTRYYVYCVDPFFRGGAVTYLATTSFDTVVSSSANVYVDVITTPAAAGPPTGGGGSGGGCFSGNTRVVTPSGIKRFDELEQVCAVITKRGPRLADLIVHEERSWQVLAMGDGEFVTPDHLICDGDAWIPARSVFPGPLKLLADKLYNLHVRAEEPGEQNYLLANGRFAHNSKVL